MACLSLDLTNLIFTLQNEKNLEEEHRRDREERGGRWGKSEYRDDKREKNVTQTKRHV